MANEIYIYNYESGALTDATAVVLSDSGAAYGIRETVTQDVTVAAGTAVVNPSTGVYVYDISALSGSLAYEYVFKITRTSGDIEYETGTIPIDPSADATESTLSMDYTDLLDGVSYFLYGMDYSDLAAAKKAICATAVKDGYRMFLFPPAAEGVPSGYEWSFLRPTTTITTTAADGDQDMPGDFGRLIGSGFTYAAGAQVPMVLADVGEGEIRRMRQRFDESGRPRFAAIRHKAGTGTTGQRCEVLWYPEPDDAYVLSYSYEALTDALTAELPYPLGGMKHADTLRKACLAAASQNVNDENGVHYDNFMRALVSSVKRDKREGAKFFGHVGSGSQYESNSAHLDSGYSLTVSGVSIET